MGASTEGGWGHGAMALPRDEGLPGRNPGWDEAGAGHTKRNADLTPQHHPLTSPRILGGGHVTVPSHRWATEARPVKQRPRSQTHKAACLPGRAWPSDCTRQACWDPSLGNKPFLTDSGPCSAQGPRSGVQGRCRQWERGLGPAISESLFNTSNLRGGHAHGRPLERFSPSVDGISL